MTRKAVTIELVGGPKDGQILSWCGGNRLEMPVCRHPIDRYINVGGPCSPREGTKIAYQYHGEKTANGFPAFTWEPPQ